MRKRLAMFSGPKSRIAADESGSVAILVALCMFVLLGAVGLAVDIGRGQLVEARLLNAADSAGLAVGARLNNTANAQAEADRFVRLNFPSGYAGAEIESVSATVSEYDSVITVSATARVPATFMALFGFDNIDVAVTSEVTRRTTGLELSLVLDVTGSMQPYMKDLKDASHALIDILYGDAEQGEELFVGIVPFSQAVNIGAARTDWIDENEMNSKDWGPAPSSWQGCVEARGNGRDTSDDLPSQELFQAYYYPDTTESILNPQTYNEWRNKGLFGSGNWRYSTFTASRGPNGNCPSAPITPLTPGKDKVSKAIDALEAVGGTHIPIGAAWGWRLLSPKWRGQWGGEMNMHDLPLDYDTRNMDKAMVLMTDGDNTMYPRDYYGAYGRLSDGRLETTNSVSRAEDELDKRLEQLCENMKNAGIIIYTVAFDNPSGATKDMLEKCASQRDYFFDSPSASDLDTAFRTIGNSLSNLRVSR